jgi:glycosyltransferase involved in cell wall biosynthesis
MKIGIDADIVKSPIRAGLYTHIGSISKQLELLVPNAVTLLVKDALPGDLKETIEQFGTSKFKRWIAPPRFYRLWLQMGMFSRFDVVWHNLGSELPDCVHPANVFLVPDIIPLTIDYGNKNLMLMYTYYYERAKRKADRIIVSSKHTKKDLIDKLGVEDNRISVVPLAAGSEFVKATPARVAAIRSTYNIADRPYLLYTSTIELRKNHAVLLRAFARLIEKNPNLPHRLLFCGGKWIGAEAVFELAEKLGLYEDRFRYLGYVDDLTSLYSGADLFVYPSHYEGFGLPILEAMACEVPVIAANATSLPEVLGDAGELFEPNDDLALADTIERMLFDTELRTNTIQKGLIRSAEFTWEKTTKGYLDAFQRAIDHKRERV